VSHSTSEAGEPAAPGPREGNGNSGIYKTGPSGQHVRTQRLRQRVSVTLPCRQRRDSWLDYPMLKGPSPYLWLGVGGNPHPDPRLRRYLPRLHCGGHWRPFCAFFCAKRLPPLQSSLSLSLATRRKGDPGEKVPHAARSFHDGRYW